MKVLNKSMLVYTAMHLILYTNLGLKLELKGMLSQILGFGEMLLKPHCTFSFLWSRERHFRTRVKKYSCNFLKQT